jgi:class 3 adenylate cyclase/tetratricopeptide (TPR) repeat protein
VGLKIPDTESERRLDAYVPRVLMRHLSESPGTTARSVDATVVFADISGFTALSERLARQGRRGAEELSDTIGGSLSTLLSVAYENGGSLLELGGDALLLLFEHDGHAGRACRAAVGMRRTLREIGRVDTGAGRVTLRISQGVHSGTFHNFLVGESHRESLLVGPAASGVVRMEKAAHAGEIVISPQTAALLPERCVGTRKGPGLRLAGEPDAGTALVEPPYEPPSLDAIASCLPVMVRSHLIAGDQPSEHRNVTIAFLRFEGTDQLIREEGVESASRALTELVTDVQRAVDRHEVCFLVSNVDDDGGKLLLTAGAPRIIGDDEERMLLALREVLDGDRRLAIRVGVNRGNVFAGEIGPPYRRTYTVMGDAVNLAARVMAQAPAGELYSTVGAIARSPTHFLTRRLEPFAAKGKAEPVQAWSVGPPQSARERAAVAVHFPLVGREREIVALTRALDKASAGHGRFVEIAGEPGIGKTRLAEEVRERADGVQCLSATAEAFTVSTPYAAWRGLLREAIGVGWEAVDEVVLDRLGALVDERAPELRPWLPLLAVPFDVDPPSTPEADALAPEFRRARLHETVIAFLRALLDGQTLIVCDDAQYLDEASADLFAAVASEIDTTRWLVLLVRREQGSFSVPQSESIIRLEPGPLAVADTRALAEAATDAAPLNPTLLDLSVERSGGNPQFLRDLLRAAADGDGEGLPESLEAAAMARIDRLDPDDRTIIRHASVLGLSFHPRFLPEVLRDHGSPLNDETWLRLEPFFQYDGNGYRRFRRVIVRDAAYAGLPYRTRRRLHAAVGLRMEQEYSSMLDEVGGLLSLHFHRAGEHAKAWRYAREAADRARDNGAFAAAADLYRRALDSARNLDVTRTELAAAWEELGEAHARAGEVTKAVEAFGKARRRLPEDVVRGARLMHRTAWVYERIGRTAPAVRWARRGLRALDGVGGRPAARERAGLVTTLAAVRRRQGRAAEAERLCREGIAQAEAAGDELLMARAYFNLDWALVTLDRAGEATHSELALEIYTRAGDSERQAAVLNNLGGFAYWDGRWQEAVDLYARAAEASERAGDLWAAAYGDCNIGEVLADQGHLEEAEERLRRARRIWHGTEDEHGVAFTTALLGRLAARAGRHEEATELLTEAARTFRDLRVVEDAALADAYLAEAAMLAGRAEDALAEADRQLADRSGPRALLLRVRGGALMRLGHREACAAALQDALVQAREHEERHEVALVLDALITLDSAAPEAAAERDEIVASIGLSALPAQPDLAAALDAVSSPRPKILDRGPYAPPEAAETMGAR